MWCSSCIVFSRRNARSSHRRRPRIQHSAKSVPGVANGNWHYQCFLHWKNIPDHQMPTPATYQGVGEIYSLEDGTCTDDMNRGVLKVILHEVCAAKE